MKIVNTNKFTEELINNLLTCQFDSVRMLDEVGFTRTAVNEREKTILLENAIEVSREKSSLYVTVQNNKLTIWKRDIYCQSFRYITSFRFTDYRNRTSIQMSLALRLYYYLSLFNSI